jgi:hypothetical protein
VDEEAANDVFEQGGAFDPETVVAMARAFDQAWRQLSLGRRAEPEMTKSIAGKIIELARDGERDAERLCALTVRALGGVTEG